MYINLLLLCQFNGKTIGETVRRIRATGNCSHRGAIDINLKINTLLIFPAKVNREPLRRYG